MSSELSIFAERLRAFMEISLEDPGPLDPESARALAQHAEIEFNGMALVLFALQFNRNAPYRKLCEARRVAPNAVTHWSEIPAVPTSAFKELELSCLPPEQRARVFHSSGTTEQRPSRHYHSAESLEIYEASGWRWFEARMAADVRRLTLSAPEGQSLVASAATGRLLSLTPPSGQAPRSSLVHMIDVIRQKIGAEASVFVGRVSTDGTWTLDCDAAFAVLSGSHRREEVETARVANPPPHVGGYERPLLVVGTAFSFVHLLDEMRARDLRLQLPAGSRVMETGGYKGRSREMAKAELHALIAERLGVPAENIICEYGMSELSSQAYQRVTCTEGQVPGNPRSQSCHLSPATCHFRFPPWARARVISPETGREVNEGETGLLRVFDLANVFSVMVIQTEDLAVRRGDGFELLGRAKLAEPRGCSLMAT